MSKWLSAGLNAIMIFGNIAVFFMYLCFIVPFYYLYEAISGRIVNSILTGDDFLLTPGRHVISAAVMQSFPSWPYAILMAIGVAINVWAGIKFLRALLEILENIDQQHYFSTENVGSLKTMVMAQLVMVVADVFMASGNQLSSSWFFRINNGVASATWPTCFDDLFVAIALGAIYVTYQHAMDIKAENDLTV